MFQSGKGKKNGKGRKMTQLIMPDDLPTVEDPIGPQCLTIMDLTRSGSTEQIPMLTEGQLLLHQQSQQQRIDTQRRLSKHFRKNARKQAQLPYDVYDTPTKQLRPGQLQKSRNIQFQSFHEQQQQPSYILGNGGGNNNIRCSHCGENLTVQNKSFWQKLTSCCRGQNVSDDESDDEEDLELSNKQEKPEIRKNTREELLKAEFIQALLAHEELNLKSLQPANLKTKKKKI